MAGEQYLALYKETTRGTAPETPDYLFLPIVKGWPQFKPTDEPRKEFAGPNTAMGDRSVRRKESMFTAPLEFLYRPGAETGLFLKHVMGFAGTRATVDTTAKKGIMYPSEPMPYGAGAPLENEAIGLVSNLDEEGVTKSQKFGGYRPTTLSATFKGTDEVSFSLEGQGAGDWVGPCDQTAIADPAFPEIDPFNCSEIAYYIGSGISRTGTAPNFTDIGPGSMQRFYPDEATMKLISGLSDKVIGNGIKGPSKTVRTGQAGGEIGITTDYADPSSGFSSADEYKRTLSGVAENSLLIVMTHTELAGAATAKYQTIIDFPLLWLQADPREPDNEGKTPPQKLTYKTLFDPAVGYPVAIMTVDQEASY